MKLGKGTYTEQCGKRACPTATQCAHWAGAIEIA